MQLTVHLTVMYPKDDTLVVLFYTTVHVILNESCAVNFAFWSLLHTVFPPDATSAESPLDPIPVHLEDSTQPIKGESWEMGNKRELGKRSSL